LRSYLHSLLSVTIPWICPRGYCTSIHYESHWWTKGSCSSTISGLFRLLSNLDPLLPWALLWTFLSR
jgi:hypothetical protein